MTYPRIQIVDIHHRLLTLPLRPRLSPPPSFFWVSSKRLTITSHLTLLHNSLLVAFVTSLNKVKPAARSTASTVLQQDLAPWQLSDRGTLSAHLVL